MSTRTYANMAGLSEALSGEFVIVRIRRILGHHVFQEMDLEIVSVTDARDISHVTSAVG